MKKSFAAILSVMMLFALAIAPNALADENEVVALKQQVADLTSKLSALESHVQTMEGHVPPTQGKEPVGYVPSASEQPAGLIHTMQDIHMSGYADMQFNQNLSNEAANVGGNPFRSFDANQNTFSINAVELDFYKAPDPEGGAGFRVDIAMGEDAQVVDTATTGTDADEFSLQQAYIEFVSPLSFFEGSELFGDTIDVKVGRFVTLAGAEVIEAPDNWNVSRSFLFGLAIPFTHTGIRAEHKLWNDQVTTYWGVNNGWDNVLDNNMWKTLEWGVGANPIENVSVLSAIYYGPEMARHSGHKRFLWSNVVGWDATEKLSFKQEFTLGNQRRVPSTETLGGGTTKEVYANAQWWGFASYMRYELTEKLGFNYRFEVFRDDQLFRTSPATTVAAPTETLTSHTLTFDYELYENLTSRLEYRLDRSNDAAAFQSDSTQQTVGAQMIYKFA